MSLLAVLVASLLGSVHCVAMCGGFATVAGGAAGRRASWRGTAAYQGGRLLGYLGLGAAAGLLGAGLDAAGGALLGLQRAAALLTGGTLVVLAIASLWPRRGLGRTASAAVGSERLVSLGTAPARVPRLRRFLVGHLRGGGLVGAGAVGLGSALLPCGWLWGYVLVAAATGAVLPAAAVMLAFWAGGLPALLSVGAAAAWLRPRLGRHAPRLVAAIMLTLGVLALAGKLGPVPVAAVDEAATVDSPAASAPAPCHGPHAP
jgi:sulfite exporter TauE/SafE